MVETPEVYKESFKEMGDSSRYPDLRFYGKVKGKIIRNLDESIEDTQSRLEVVLGYEAHTKGCVKVFTAQYTIRDPGFYSYAEGIGYKSE
jgi:hypothetical protein